nr:hypothetical protein [Tanacetum cinerariifolium]
MQNLKDISNPTTALDMALELMAKAFKLNNTTPTKNNQIISSNPSYSQIAQSGKNIDQYRHMLIVDDNIGNQFRQNAVQLSVVPGIANQHENGNVVAARAEGAYEEIERDNANCTLENNLQQASTSEKQYTELLVSIPELHQVPQSDSNVIYEVSEQKDTIRGTSANTKFAKQSILGKPSSSSRPKLYAVTPLPKSTVFPKVGETHALLKPVTSNSFPILTESKAVKNDNVIFPGIFRINTFKASMVDNFVPNKHIKASVGTKPITVSQPHVITKNDVKENPKKDKIRSKPDKNGKRGEAEKSQKQLQWIEQGKLKKMQKEGPKMQTHTKSTKVLRKKEKKRAKVATL